MWLVYTDSYPFAKMAWFDSLRNLRTRLEQNTGARVLVSHPIEAHTGLRTARAVGRDRKPASAVGFPVAGLGPAPSSRRKKGGDPVTCSFTVICEVVAS